jgi:outer membrane protein OmpA-like peptidoglycan-associated protein
MRRQRHMMASFRLWRSLLGVSALVLLSGCGWFGGGTQLDSQKARPGADRAVAGSGALPSANPGRQYEPGFAATDETRTPQVGSIVAGKGGQKAQKEAVDKEAAERDAKDREAREKREAADREAKAKEKEKEPPTAARSSLPGLPGRPAAAEPGNADSSRTTPVTAPGTAPAPTAPATPPVTAAPPPAPVTSTPVPPPPANTPPAPEPPAPSRTSLPSPQDAPAVASASPSRWAPPGGVTPAVATADQRATFTPASAAPGSTVPAPAPPPPAQASKPAPEVAPIAAPAPVPAPVAPPPRRTDPNKAFEPPPGWLPPAQAAAQPPAPAPSPPASSEAKATPPAPVAVPPRPADPNKAFVPPAGWTSPEQAPRVAAAAPPPTAAPTPVVVPTPSQAMAPQPPVVPPARSADPNKAFVPPPGWMPPGQIAAAAPALSQAMVSQPATQVAAAAPPTAAPVQVAVIQFGPMSVELNGKDQAVLARVAQVQRSNGGKVRIVAHSAQDAAGSSPDVLARDNFEVSRQRALTVANQLMRLGVPANRIAAEAASDEEPAYETNTARGIAANRRAEIFVEF